MNDKTRIARLYANILQQIKRQKELKLSPKHKYKVEPILLKETISLNNTTDVTQISNKSINSIHIKKKPFKITETVVKRKQKITNKQIELETELMIFRKEVETKYKKSVTNKSYHFPIKCEISDNDPTVENVYSSLLI